jgi:hypothetical protein
MQAWLRRRWSQTRVILGRQDHHRILAVQGYTLWPLFPSLSHDLAEMSFSILKLPSRE